MLAIWKASCGINSSSPLVHALSAVCRKEKAWVHYTLCSNFSRSYKRKTNNVCCAYHLRRTKGFYGHGFGCTSVGSIVISLAVIHAAVCSNKSLLHVGTSCSLIHILSCPERIPQTLSLCFLWINRIGPNNLAWAAHFGLDGLFIHSQPGAQAAFSLQVDLEGIQAHPERYQHLVYSDIGSVAGRRGRTDEKDKDKRVEPHQIWFGSRSSGRLDSRSGLLQGRFGRWVLCFSCWEHVVQGSLIYYSFIFRWTQWYQIHKCYLLREPSAFGDMLSLPFIDETSHTTPILLYDTAEQFRDLVWALYAP